MPRYPITGLTPRATVARPRGTPRRRRRPKVNCIPTDGPVPWRQHGRSLLKESPPCPLCPRVPGRRTRIKFSGSYFTNTRLSYSNITIIRRNNCHEHSLNDELGLGWRESTSLKVGKAIVRALGTAIRPCRRLAHRQPTQAAWGLVNRHEVRLPLRRGKGAVSAFVAKPFVSPYFAAA